MIVEFNEYANIFPTYGGFRYHVFLSLIAENVSAFCCVRLCPPPHTPHIIIIKIYYKICAARGTCSFTLEMYAFDACNCVDREIGGQVEETRRGEESHDCVVEDNTPYPFHRHTTPIRALHTISNLIRYYLHLVMRWDWDLCESEWNEGYGERHRRLVVTVNFTPKKMMTNIEQKQPPLHSKVKLNEWLHVFTCVTRDADGVRCEIRFIQFRSDTPL